jgi:hypothetical protein
MSDQNNEERSENVLSIAPVLRDKVLRVKTLGTGAKLLFSKLTDLVFLRKLSLGLGVVKIGRPSLAEMLGCSECTIDRYADELERDGRIWRKVIYEARSKMTAWYIREIAESQLEFSDRASQSFGPARVKRPQPVRGTNGKFAKLPSPQICFDGKILENEAVVPNLTALSPQYCGEHHGNSAETVPAESTVLNRQNGRDHHGNSAVIISAELRGQSPQILSAVNGKTAETIKAGVPSKEDIHTVNGRDTGYSFKRSTGLNALKNGGAKKISAENAFLADVAEVMEAWRKGSAKDELINSGAWWRQSHRANADLIGRVLADTRCAVKEGRIKTTPGQYAVDLWKRWSADLLRDLTRKKTAATAAART